MRKTCFIFLVALATCLRGEEVVEEVEAAPEKRLISTFQIVRFPNDACVGTASRNGTCYTSAECSDKGGTSSGSCADGFGVCCTFIIDTCGQTASENITYWDVTPTVATTAPSGCSLKVCPMNENICQLRIDFTTFVITGPSSNTIQELFKQLGQTPKSQLGNLAAAGDQETSWKTNCLIDTFSVNGKTSANIPPTICGTNSGVHMYVDANMNDCNVLNFRFSGLSGSTTPAVGIIDTRGLTSLATRDWDMTIYQYECGYVNQAPPGCTQYFWGSTGGRVASFNRGAATPIHLANQNQKICIRRERGVCWLCFADDAIATNFEFGGNNNVDNAFTAPGLTCGYSCQSANGLAAANEACGSYDCVMIPGALGIATSTAPSAPDTGIDNALLRTQAVTTANVPFPPQMSSNGVLGIGAVNLHSIYETPAGSDVRATVCTKHYPFMFQFKSDGWEGDGEDGDQITSQQGINLPWYTVTCV